MTSTGPKSLQEEINDMPLVDEDAPEVLSDDDDAGRGGAVAAAGNIPHEMSIESMSSGIGSPANTGHQPPNGEPDQEKGAEESDEMAEEKERLIQQIMELQNTLDDLSMRVDSVKEENLKLRSENQVLSQYIENLMSASNVFQSTSPNKTSSGGKKKGKK